MGFNNPKIRMSSQPFTMIYNEISDDAQKTAIAIHVAVMEDDAAAGIRQKPSATLATLQIR